MNQAGERRAKVGAFAIGLDDWCEQGPTHHCALGVGHHAGTLRKVARLLGLEFVAVGEAGRG